VDVSENRNSNGNGSNGSGSFQGSEDWFEQRVGPDEPPVRFVERRQGGRRRHDTRMMAELPSSALPTPSVSLVIPTRNEARNVADVLDRLPKMITEVILVDASSDVTKLMARSSRSDIRIIGEPAPGKGNALRAGLAAATGDVVVAMDADGSMSPEEIPRFVHPLAHGFDFTKGSRFMAGGGSLDITPIRRAGNRALVEAANLLLGVRYTDLCYGFFAFRKIFFDSLDLRSTGFEIETEIIVRAQLIGLRIAEVPSVELPRRNGESSLRAVRDGTRVLRTLLMERKLQRAAGGAAGFSPELNGDRNAAANGHRPGAADRPSRPMERPRPRDHSIADPAHGRTLN
jgi:hypothetical protein